MTLGAGLKQTVLSLQALIAATVILGLLCATTIAYLYSAQQLKAQHLSEVQGELKQVTDLTMLAMREPLWQFAPGEADSIIDSVFVNPNVLSIDVRDHAGLVFTRRSRTNTQELKDAGFTTSTLRQVMRDGDDIGRIEIVMSTAGYITKLEATRGQFFRVTASISLVALVIILVVLQFNFVRPVNRLVRESARLATGMLGDPIEPSNLTELGTLAKSLEVTRQALIQLINDLEKRNSELQAANANLEMRVDERTQSLTLALDNLRRAQEEMIQSEKLASLGRIVATVAHELNTPIGNARVVASTIAQNVKQLLSEIKGPAPKRSKLIELAEHNDQGIVIFMRSIERASELISNFKQVAVDQTSDQRRAFDLAEVTTEVLSTLHAFAKKYACVLCTELQTGILCNSYPGAYGQALTNLVMNAVIHGYSNGVGGNIYVSVRSMEAGQACLTVRDEGVGMGIETQRKIFDPFFTTRMGQGGSGLGMNIVHGIARKTLGGSISVASTEGCGSEITIVFPVHSPSVPSAAESPV